jgi:hypothetical protein
MNSARHGSEQVPEASAALEAFIDETIRRAAKVGYHPTVFIGMREKLGTVTAISKLVESGDVQSGFKRLSKLGLLDWTIEAAVGKFPSEFSATARECAAFRLKSARELL